MGVGMPASYPFCGLPYSSFLHEAPLLPGSYFSQRYDKMIEEKWGYVKDICLVKSDGRFFALVPLGNHQISSRANGFTRLVPDPGNVKVFSHAGYSLA
jgi:hypothetical protein